MNLPTREFVVAYIFVLICIAIIAVSLNVIGGLS